MRVVKLNALQEEPLGEATPIAGLDRGIGDTDTADDHP